MKKEIKYTGFSETPSDYVCPDGDLATVVGMVPEDGAVKPIQQPTTLFTLPEGYTVVFIHKNTGYTNYIICHEESNRKTYYWITTPEPRQVFLPEDFNSNNMIYSLQNKAVYELNALGDTLMILVDDGVYYFLFKESSYRFLGSKMPETHLSFGLDCEIVDGDETEFQIDKDIAKNEYKLFLPFPSTENWERGDGNSELFHESDTFDNDFFKEEVTKGVAAAINKFIASESTEKGKFIFPFFVRYAYRLYDTSHYMASPPILMLADTGLWTPRAYITERHFNGEDDHEILGDQLFAVPVLFKVRPRGLVFALDYEAITLPPDLSDWKDIITDIDIFISAPIYTYNQAGKVEGFKSYLSDMPGYFVGKDPIWHETYARRAIRLYTPDWESCKYTHDHCEFIVPHFDDADIIDKVKNTRDFYLLKSIPIDKLQTTRAKLEIDKDYLQSLTNRERLTDDYLSHDAIASKYSFVYNQRLNLTGISRALSPSMPPKVVATYSNYNLSKYDIYVVINEGGREIVVKALDTDVVSSLQDGNPFLYFFYPNIYATKAIIKRHHDNDPDSDDDLIYELPLRQHDFLNGAVYFNGWNRDNLDPVPSPSQEEPVPSTDRTVAMPNKLYVSEVGNPFVFMARGIVSVGTGNIIGVRPIVKAMSLAQYGEHDLYVFSSEGVWSLKVDSEGYFQHPHLATPDIVLGNGESITQIDGAVLFATDRGIMLISGSDSVCISDSLFSNTPFRPLGNTPADDMLPGLRNIAGERLQQMQLDLFRNFISDCRMTYDYRHQRIIVYSPTHSYAYVYSIKSKKWGMMPSYIQSSPLNYPAALAMVTGEDKRNVLLVDYAKDNMQDGAIRVQNGLIITRPLKLDYPDVLKTVNTVIQRGKFKTGHIKSIIYGSRDLLNWQLVWSSVDQYLRGFSGTPYKYFCLAMICNLEEGEDLLGCSIEFLPRLANQLR